MRSRSSILLTALALAIAVVVASASGKKSAVNPGDAPRECVLDRKIHLEEGIAKVPDVPPLCDTLKIVKRRVAIGDCQLYCETEGSGPALVLINGGPGGTHHDFHPYFGRAATFATVVYYDQRGCGQSDYAKGKGYTIRQAVDDLDKLRAALNLEKLVVLGWSYGGVLAQLYTVTYPERVAGLVLVGSSPDAFHLALQPTRQYDFLSPKERKKIAAVHHNGSLSLAQSVFNAHLNGDWKRQSFYRPTLEELARTALYGWKHDPLFRQSICADLRQIDLRNLFQGCPVPVLLLEGRQDLTWGSDKPGKLAQCFPGSRLTLFELAAHAPFADEPDKFFSALQDFMKVLPEKPAELATWKKQIVAGLALQDESRKRAAAKFRFSQTFTFKTAENAPESFDAWTFFWTGPQIEPDAEFECTVTQPDGKNYFKWVRQPGRSLLAGEDIRSDFAPGLSGGDPRVFYNKQIRITFRATKGDLGFDPGRKYSFTFYRGGIEGTVVKTIRAVMETP